MGSALVTVHAADQVLPGTGQAAPGFTLPSQDGSQIALDSFKGKWVVLYFYPKDMTQGCTIEAHNFQRDLAQFEAKNAVIVGVSVDTPDSHKQFCTKEGPDLPPPRRSRAQGRRSVRLTGPLRRDDHCQSQHLPHRSARQDCEGM
jgi:cytochrome oxidase Cu insertion factor (SCO1/SenC/PrrC family)